MRKREAAAEVAAIPVGQLQREAAAIQRELASCPSESRAIQLGAEALTPQQARARERQPFGGGDERAILGTVVTVGGRRFCLHNVAGGEGGGGMATAWDVDGGGRQPPACIQLGPTEVARLRKAVAAEDAVDLGTGQVGRSDASSIGTADNSDTAERRQARASRFAEPKLPAPRPSGPRVPHAGGHMVMNSVDATH